MSEPPPGINLTPQETDHLAAYLAARAVVNAAESIEWEDYPWLGEHAFDRLVDALTRLGKDRIKESADFDRLHDIDSREILERTL